MSEAGGARRSHNNDTAAQTSNRRNGETMTHRKLLYCAVALLLAVVWLAAAPMDAFAAAQKSPLVDDTQLNCTGTTVGKSSIKTKADGEVKVKVKIKSGNPNDSGVVYWTCTQVSNGCHDEACGFLTIGLIDTDSNGKGKFTTLLMGNPYPGEFVHLDLVMNSGLVYDSVFPSVPLSAGHGASGASGGDPTK